MANILLGVTGSVAAIKTPLLYDALARSGHQVKVVATQASLYFFNPAEVGAGKAPRTARDPQVVILDDDEWLGRDAGRRYEREDPVLHIELRRWAELLLIAPLDANSLAKLANGLADNCLTCVWRAWDTSRPVVLAPAMNTLMWQHPATFRHLRLLASDAGARVPDDLPLEQVIDWINNHCAALRIVAPESRRLACGDVGAGAIADAQVIVQVVESLLRKQ